MIGVPPLLKEKTLCVKRFAFNSKDRYKIYVKDLFLDILNDVLFIAVIFFFVKRIDISFSSELRYV